MNEASPAPARAPLCNVTVDAVVVGAGFGGLYMVHRLREAGFSVQGIEAGGGPGGTWYWNRYPGARCDVPSQSYSYTWSEDLRRSWRWTEKYAGQPEILRYIDHVADRFDLRRSILFDTRVTKATFDDGAQRWTVETSAGDRITAKFCIMATGCLSVPREPDVKGTDRFKGAVYVTGRWPHEPVSFRQKRVAVIGTGSSGVQSIPVIAAEASHVYVFQRTPNFSLPAVNRPLTEADIEEFEAKYPAYKDMLREGNAGALTSIPERDPTDDEWAVMKESSWGGGGLFSLYTFPNFMYSRAVNEATAEFVRGKIRETVANPATAEKLSPRGYPIGAKRLCLDTNYYETFNRKSVSLIDLKETPIEEITEEGVRTSRETFPVDMIVFATGFDAMTGALLKIDIRGRGGRALCDDWAHGPKTYLGLGMAGYPNLFTITGPGSPSVLSNVITSCEQHVDWIMDCLGHMRDRGLTLIEAEAEAQDEWVAHVYKTASRTLFLQADSWYLGANVPGKPRVFMPYTGGGYKKRCDAIAANGYEGFGLS